MLMSDEIGTVNAPRKARRVLVPMEMLASNVSAPPKTLRMRAEALWGTIRSQDEKMGINEKGTHCATFVIAQLCRTRKIITTSFLCPQDYIDIIRSSKRVSRKVDKGFYRSENVCLFECV